MTLNEQLKKVRKALKLTQTKFAKEIGLSQTSLGMIEVGERKVQDRHIKTICSLFNVNEEWFRTGKGEMFKVTNNDLLTMLANQYNLTEKEVQIAEYCLKMTSEERAYILKHVLNIANIINNTTEKVPDNSVQVQDSEKTYQEKMAEVSTELLAEEKGKISTVSTITNISKEKEA